MRMMTINVEMMLKLLAAFFASAFMVAPAKPEIMGFDGADADGSPSIDPITGQNDTARLTS